MSSAWARGPRPGIGGIAGQVPTRPAPRTRPSKYSPVHHGQATRRTGNLPAEATSFIGRRHELAELRKTLTAARLVSLVGPGGVGKTRLAIRAATDVARGFRDGAWLVELADVRDSALVSNAVLAALDLRNQTSTAPLDLLLAYLHDKELLAEYADGLICLSACIGGELPQAILGGDMDAAESVARPDRLARNELGAAHRRADVGRSPGAAVSASRCTPPAPPPGARCPR